MTTESGTSSRPRRASRPPAGLATRIVTGGFSLAVCLAIITALMLADQTAVSEEAATNVTTLQTPAPTVTAPPSTPPPTITIIRRHYITQGGGAPSSGGSTGGSNVAGAAPPTGIDSALSGGVSSGVETAPSPQVAPAPAPAPVPAPAPAPAPSGRSRAS